MRLKYFFFTVTIAVFLVFATSAAAQIAPLRGTVKIVGANGQAAPVAGALVDVFRTDIAADYHTKTDKKGEWVFAGLPYVGTYIIAVSAPGAQANAKGGVKFPQNDPINVVLLPGDGKRLTLEEAKAAIAAGSPGPGGTESAADRAKRAEELAKAEEVKASNEKILASNKIAGDSFAAGNTALGAAIEADRAKKFDEAIKLYSDAIQQYDTGLAADPEQPSLLTQKSQALKARGVIRFNAAIQLKDQAAKTAAMHVAKSDFKGGAEASNKAAGLIKLVPPATDPNAQKQQAINKYAALSVRSEAMR